MDDYRRGERQLVFPALERTVGGGTMQHRCRGVVLVGMTAAIVANGWAGSADGGIFANRQRVPNRCGLPAYAYSQGGERTAVSTLAIASERPVAASEDAADDGTTDSRRMRFLPAEPSLKIENVQLQQIALELHSSGRLTCTGRISHDGGPEGALLGANVAIRVRAYAGTSQHANVDVDAVMLWETTHVLWVGRNQPRVISLLPATYSLCYRNGDQARFTSHTNCDLARLAKRHFPEVTHLQVELEYRKDR